LYLQKEEGFPVLIECALIHYQFETIHPFLEGNGRVGRLLITLFLYWRHIIEKPLLYLSFYFKKYRQEYYDRLNLVRDRGDYEQWIAFFLEGVIQTARSAIETAKKILALQTNHRNLLWQENISSPLAVGILEKLFFTPYISNNDVAQLFDISFQSASILVAQFEKAGILKEITGKKRDKRFIYEEYIRLFEEGTKP
jgi:Fic family protein